MKVKILIIVGFLVVFAAGAVVGTATRPMLHRPPPPPPGQQDRGGFLQRELNLTPDQAEKVREIWSNLAGGREKYVQQRSQISRTRDEKIRALLSDQQKQQVDAIYKEAEKEQTDLETQRETDFKDAVAKTNAVLNPEQQKKYAEMIAKQREHGGERGRFRGHGPTTRPQEHP